MSKINTDYGFFNVFDYKGDNVLSSYSLSITPLTFHAKIPNTTESILNRSKVTFDFGDGTTSNLLTSTHVYNRPGVYNVKMIVRDCFNNSLLLSYSQNVTIHDYIENTFNVDTQLINLSAGELSVPITIDNKTPFYQDIQSIYYSASGTSLPNFSNLEKFKFNHLKKYYSFYTREYLPTLDNYEYVESAVLSPTAESIYVKLSGTEIIRSNASEGVLAGLSGSGVYYFKIDSVENTDKINIRFFKDRNNINQRGLQGNQKQNFSNTLSIYLSANVGSTSFVDNISSLSVTSNGLTNEGNEVNVFEIDPIQFKLSPIPFLLKPSSIADYTIKDLSIVGDPYIFVEHTLGNGSEALLTESLESILVDAVAVSGFYIVNNYNSLSTVDTDFWYYGSLFINDNNSQLDTYSITFSANFTNGTDIISLSNTVTIDVYPRDYYSIYKFNEDIDFTQALKDLRFQEILLDKNILFDDFLGTIFGDISSKTDTLGKTVYEKVINFVQNTKDIDLCEVDQLDSIGSMVNLQDGVADNTNLVIPNKLRDIISRLSVASYNKLRGTKNKFVQNFDSKGRVIKDIYGKNLGDTIDASTYIVSAGTDIVAYEKFSGNYSLLNTFQPICAVSSTTFKLSEYSSNWGWPLVLPNTFTFDDLNKFYIFYEFNNVIDGIISDGLVDYNNALTTLEFDVPLSSFRGDGMIDDIIIRNTLFDCLSVF